MKFLITDEIIHLEQMYARLLNLVGSFVNIAMD